MDGAWNKFWMKSQNGTFIPLQMKAFWAKNFKFHAGVRKSFWQFFRMGRDCCVLWLPRKIGRQNWRGPIFLRFDLVKYQCDGFLIRFKFNWEQQQIRSNFVCKIFRKFVPSKSQSVLSTERSNIFELFHKHVQVYGSEGSLKGVTKGEMFQS